MLQLTLNFMEASIAVTVDRPRRFAAVAGCTVRAA
jgi:hypothetical protein